MPPAAVKTIRDLIFYQYAKLIAKSANMKKNYGFIMHNYKKLKNDEIHWSGTMREYLHEQENPNICFYCGKTENLSIDHLIARKRGGIDDQDNAIMACKSCNSSKGSKGVYEWYQLVKKDEIPRIVEGKYLKMLYKMHHEKNTLNHTIQDLEALCSSCQPGYLCPTTALTVYCLESIF